VRAQEVDYEQAIELAGAAQAGRPQVEADRTSAAWRSPDARRAPKSPWQDLQRHEIPQQKWTTEESRLLAHLVTQHTDAKGHPMWIRIAPLLNGRTPQVAAVGVPVAAAMPPGEAATMPL
jgi:hypothetical protein